MTLESRIDQDGGRGSLWAVLPMNSADSLAVLDTYTGGRAATLAMLDGRLIPGAATAAPSEFRSGGRIQLAQTAATAGELGGVGIELPDAGRALGALSRLPPGAVLVGLLVVTAAMAWKDIAGAERAQVEQAITKFGLDRTQARDVLAARGYVWAVNFAWIRFWEVPKEGEGLEKVAQAIMRNELANPGMLGRYTYGDAEAAKGIEEVVAEAMAGILPELTEPVYRTSSVAPALSTSSTRARALLGLTSQSWQAHHLIPFAVVGSLPPPVQLAMVRAGWAMDSVENLIALPANFPTYYAPPNNQLRPVHNTSHPVYSANVRAKLLHVSVAGAAMPGPALRNELGAVERSMQDYLLVRRPEIHPQLQ